MKLRSEVCKKVNQAEIDRGLEEFQHGKLIYL